MKKILSLCIIIAIITEVIPCMVSAADADVQMVYDALTEEMLTSDNEPENSVTKNLDFNIGRDIEIPDGVSVSFLSGNESVVANDGTVIRDERKKKDVTITATISKGEESVTKELKFTVLPLAYEVVASDNLYYPEKLNEEFISYEAGSAVNAVPGWSLNNHSATVVEKEINAKFLKDSNGYYNLTATRINDYEDVGATATPIYLQYTPENIPSIIQTGEDKSVNVTLNLNPVTWGNTVTKQFYVIIYGEVSGGQKAVADLRFYNDCTRIYNSSGSSVFETSENYVNIGQNNEIEARIDYNSKLVYLYLNGTLLNPDGTYFSDLTYNRQISNIQIGYFREMTGSVMQVNDVTITRELKVLSEAEEVFEALTEEILTTDNEPENSITKKLDFDISDNIEIPDGISVEISSDDTSIIANDGTVSRDEKSKKEVTVTATVTDGEEILTKKLNYTVLPLSSEVVASDNLYYPDYEDCEIISYVNGSATHTVPQWSFNSYSETVLEKEINAKFLKDNKGYCNLTSTRVNNYENVGATATPIYLKYTPANIPSIIQNTDDKAVNVKLNLNPITWGNTVTKQFYVMIYGEVSGGQKVVADLRFYNDCTRIYNSSGSSVFETSENYVNIGQNNEIEARIDYNSKLVYLYLNGTLLNPDGTYFSDLTYNRQISNIQIGYFREMTGSVMQVNDVTITRELKVLSDVETVYESLTEEVITTDNEPETSVTKNLNLDAVAEFSEGVTVTFSSSNTAVIADDGTVTRDANIKKDVVVTATISKDGEFLKKELNFTVLPLTYEVITSDNLYYPEHAEVISYASGNAVQAVPAWGLTNSSPTIVEKEISAKYVRDINGYYNLTTTRVNDYADVSSMATAIYLKYTPENLPAIIQTVNDKAVSIKFNLNPVTWGNTVTKQFYVVIEGDGYGGKVADLRFYNDCTRIYNASGECIFVSSDIVNIGQNNEIDVQIDYNLKLIYLYLDGKLLNPGGTIFTDSVYVKQISNIQIGYFREMTGAIMQVNDVTISRLTDVKVGSVNDVTAEIVADGQAPWFIVKDINIPSNSEITWKSNKPDVITDKGVVIRPMTEDEEVIITATSGDVTKELCFTVKALTASRFAVNDSYSEAYYDSALLGTESNVFTSAAYAVVDGRYLLDFKGESVLEIPVETFPVGSNGKYIFEFDAISNPESVVNISGNSTTIGAEWKHYKVEIPASSVGNSISFGGNSPLQLDNIVIYTEGTADDAIKGMPNNEKAEYFAKLISYDTISNGISCDITENLSIDNPLKDFELEDLGVSVVWTSSNPDVITNNGIVTRKPYNSYAVMTATITAGEGEDAVSVTKSFTYTVAAEESIVFENRKYTFEEDASTDWNTYSNASSVVTSVEGRTGQVLHADFTGSGYVRMRETSGGTLDKRYSVSADVCFAPDTAATKTYFELVGEDVVTRVGFNYKTGAIIFLGDDEEREYMVPGVKAKIGEWYHIDIDFNAAQKNFKAYINGVAITESPLDMGDNVWSDSMPVRTVGIYSYGTGKGYIDNVVIRQSDNAIVYDETGNYTVRKIWLENSRGITITNAPTSSANIYAKVKLLANDGAQRNAKIIFARYRSGKLEQIISAPVETVGRGQIASLMMPLTGDCSEDVLKVFVSGGNSISPVCKNLNSKEPKFDAERLFAMDTNVTYARDLGYEAESDYEGIEAIIYDGDTYLGRKTKHFAYIGLPEGASAENPVPAVVCVHGGGGTAYDEWVKKWNERGYAAIAMNLNGRIPQDSIVDGNYQLRHAWAGAHQDNYGTVSPDDATWMYSAVTAVIAGHNVLREMPEIDDSRIGIIGVSWGGVVTSTTIGVDNRFAFAIPSYGCGFLYGSETYMADIMTYDKKLWDASNFIAKADLPILWMNGDKDGNFSLTSTTKSSLLAGENSYTAIIPGFGHGHGATWDRPEPYAFADSIVKGGNELIKGVAAQSGNTVTATTNLKAKSAALYYTTAAKLEYRSGTTPLYDFTMVSTFQTDTNTFSFTLPSNATMYYVTFSDGSNATSTVLYEVN